MHHGVPEIKMKDDYFVHTGLLCFHLTDRLQCNLVTVYFITS